MYILSTAVHVRAQRSAHNLVVTSWIIITKFETKRAPSLLLDAVPNCDQVGVELVFITVKLLETGRSWLLEALLLRYNDRMGT